MANELVQLLFDNKNKVLKGNVHMNTPLVKRAYNLGLKAVPNFVGSLTEDEITYWEQHLDEIPTAIRRGFILPGRETAAASVLSALYKASETDLDYWLDQTQKFAAKHLGITIDLRKHFDIPAELPWKSVIPVFDPGDMTIAKWCRRH